MEEPGENEDKDDEDSDIGSPETKDVEKDTDKPSEPEDKKIGGNEYEDKIQEINTINFPLNESLSGFKNKEDNESDKNKENNKLLINSSPKPSDVGAGNNKTNGTGRTTRTATTGNSQGIVKDNYTHLKADTSIEVRKVLLKASRVTTIVKIFLEIKIPIPIYPTTHIPPSI